jgi:hypothetical protein
MTDTATAAREAAMNCEAKFYAFRKTKDGTIVSFVLHPQDVPDGLATAEIGARFVLALVEIGEDEKPLRRNV